MPIETIDNHELLQDYNWQESTSAVGVMSIGPAGAMYRCERCGHIFQHGKTFTGTLRCVRCLKATTKPDEAPPAAEQQEPQEVDKAAVVLAQLIKAGKRQTADQVAKGCCISPKDALATLYRLHDSWLADQDRKYWEPAPLIKDLALLLKDQQQGPPQAPTRKAKRSKPITWQDTIGEMLNKHGRDHNGEPW